MTARFGLSTVQHILKEDMKVMILQSAIENCYKEIKNKISLEHRY